MLSFLSGLGVGAAFNVCQCPQTRAARILIGSAWARQAAWGQLASRRRARQLHGLEVLRVSPSGLLELLSAVLHNLQ